MANDITSINSSRSQLSSTTNNSVKPQDEDKSGNSKNTATVGDRMTLTNTASHLQNIEKELNSSSPVDAEHVANIKKAISSGEYSVNPDRIADKMLAFEDFMNK